MGTLAVVELPFRTGLPEDVTVNTFAIGGLTAQSSAIDHAAVADAVGEIYTDTPAGHTVKIGSYLSPVLSRVANACTVKLYDISAHLDGSPHGSPYFERTFTLPASLNAAGLPDEVAVALQLEAAGRAGQLVETVDGTDVGTAPDRPRQRYTGRVFLGPLNLDALEVIGPSGQVRPESQFLDCARAAFEQNAEQIFQLNPTTWFGVWSRANQSIRSISDVSTKDCFDTMRSRGIAPSVRTRNAVAVTANVELAA